MPTQRLCVTVTAPTMAELRVLRDAASDADLVELRLDTVRDPDVRGALADRRRPVVVTCRARWEGGAFGGSEEERKRILSDALSSGAEYVDIEARAGFDDLVARRQGRGIVLSMHDFDGMPADLASRVRAMKATGAEVVKAAVTTTRLTDAVALLDLSSRLDAGGHVLVGMGDAGLVTRVLPARFGSKWSYAGALAGLGQLTPSELIDEFGFRRHGPETALYGVAGSPIGHSMSPVMHNAAFRAAGLDAVYLPLPAVDADDFVSFARAFRLKGANVTIPYKVALFGRVNRTSDVARRIGAINTIRVVGDRWVGDNSDVNGFLAPLGDRGRPAGLPALGGVRAALLGAGGAARAVAVALAANGARVSVHARNPQRAAEVAQLASGSAGPPLPARGSWDLLVNCTPVGMYPDVDATPLPSEYLSAGTVYDLVYNPQATRLLREAARAGCRTIGGLEMLVGQARQAFEWWTGVRPEASVMREAAIGKLGSVQHENHVV